MGSAPPDGDPAPPDGSLPAAALASVGERGLGLYLHVPFCARRCGYCDFNTYTAAELGPPGGPPGASQDTYADAAIAEIRFARKVLGGANGHPVETVFLGGGTPTLLPAEHLVRMLRAVDDELGLAPGAEVTTEANPDSVTPAALEVLRRGGFNRISFGMQSSVSHVLRMLDRTHDPDGVPRAVQWARDAGFEQVSLDLIYGTPGESLDDWRRSLESALACGPDHVSAYALIVEDGTALARRVGRGDLPAPDDDDLADKYVLADEALTAAGLSWYELSNWARDEAARCRHNLLYWRGGDWWGIGPGAHSHVGGVRFWNVRSPRTYAARIAAGVSPAEAREVLDEPTARMERILLETRLVEGLPVAVLEEDGRSRLPELRASGLVGPEPERVVLTRRGRLLADAIVRDLVP
jgi:oxygen-independent coproporphyrinogen-3 oxidase